MRTLIAIGRAALCGALVAAVTVAIGMGTDLYTHGPNPKVGWSGELVESSILVTLAGLFGSFVGAAFGTLIVSVNLRALASGTACDCPDASNTAGRNRLPAD